MIEAQRADPTIRQHKTVGPTLVPRASSRP
jgi:hypothetical protein